MSEEKVRGIVKWFSQIKGYGFLISGENDYFVHSSEIKEGDELKEGDDVEFLSEKSEKGLRASSVTKIGE